MIVAAIATGFMACVLPLGRSIPTVELRHLWLEFIRATALLLLAVSYTVWLLLEAGCCVPGHADSPESFKVWLEKAMNLPFFNVTTQA